MGSDRTRSGPVDLNKKEGKKLPREYYKSSFHNQHSLKIVMCFPGSPKENVYCQHKPRLLLRKSCKIYFSDKNVTEKMTNCFNVFWFGC